jgi:large subunit ribosomal protein L17
MRHGKKINHLGRTNAHREAMLANMAASLILHKRISTTLAKAKALRKYVEPLLTKSKVDSTHSRRTVFSYLQNKDAVTALFRDVAVKIADRPGGYTRILKTGNRLGDNAEMCFIELVDYNENMLGAGKAKKAAKPTRRRGGSKKKADAAVTEAEVITETPEAAATTPVETPEAPKKGKKKPAKEENTPEEGGAE